MKSIQSVMTVLLLISAANKAEPGEQLEYRLIYLSTNLQVKENLDKVTPILKRASKAGYNGVVLADYKLNILDRVPNHYFENAKQFRDLCANEKLQVIPCVAAFGYSSGILAHDPNLAEGLPAKDTHFVVNDGNVSLFGSNQSLIPGEFEVRQKDIFAGWGFQDEPGSGTFADTKVKHGGSSSLRIENPRGTRGNRRVNKRIKVEPWKQYHASVWIKTEDVESASETRMFAMTPSGRTLSHSHLGVKKTQDWTKHHIVFNSLDATEIQFYIGAWDCGSGRLWMDDAELIQEPFVNLVRRSQCPLTVRNSKGLIYEEGLDFEKLVDTKMGINPWAGEFDVYHEPPKLKLTRNSRIKEGEHLFVSYYHAVTVYDNQVSCSLSAPKVFEVVDDQVRRVQELFHPAAYMLSHDEIRVANWSEPEMRSGKSAGDNLADNVRKCCEIIRKHNKDAKLFVWSDMFDPHHNAVKDYYLVNGDLSGSLVGLPKDAIIMNWNSGKAEQSMRFFAERGHVQVLAGYYDAKPESIVDWLAKAEKQSLPRGVMYTTWQNNFAHLEAFAKAAWGSQ